MKRLAPAMLAAILAGSVSSVAVAAPPVVAKLQAPLAKAKRPIAGQAAFTCDGDTCTALSPASDTNSVPSCRELVRHVGAVASFGVEGNTLDEAKLARCNAAARK